MNRKALSAMLFVAMIAVFTTQSYSEVKVRNTTEQPSQQQPVKPIARQADLFTVQIKGPAYVVFHLKVNAVSGWEENEYGGQADIERAQITYQQIYGKDSLQCMIGTFPMTSRLVEKGTCVVGSDKKSFNCNPVLLK